MRYALAWPLLVCVGALLGACKSPATNFYTLSPDESLAGVSATGAVANAAAATRPIAAVVGPVTIPELVDRPQIVTRVSGNEVVVNEFDRWAQPLTGDIGRVIAADLGALLNSEQISVFDAVRDPAVVWHVRIDVMRFDSVPGRDVTVDVLWAVRPPGKGRALTGRSIARESVSGPGFGPLVAAHDRALGTVSRAIAAAVQANATQ
ncbi:PqiC family protein [Paraburkholderia antibiotica]|uniref:Membrane integrity-associated transporter subunit PqiC n=1 Tax=Paraburkholderia antibiotica TaxID=2728839 RepID=A0A7X9X343_9BURK|nr:PqiC family protein [Paraburkholderia antibiotica]NML30542.1 membrane integrity-associated transporter subunit PqiC [Paraburkholderia antibiotica]